ncbi:Bacterio-opsin activator HTH domain protein [Halovivax asiaticus JCM 14624]|uniref:Bacterio-opsin activator HTH domain protein n=1 Tax=Halovivax asiaticus JCM 14624 TaxID=1227490 RepID=M0BKC8_9EURY|nr:helix-turn-helix domain-containing protein [Halovivax asiaticus]ELZ10763.1 Bacterio-opsin activator HTH domain protein [Halovivax asiaticus JCM 14624]
MTGYQATIVVDDPGGCPVAVAADELDAPVDSISRSSTRDAETVVEEFTVQDPDGSLAGDAGETDAFERPESDEHTRDRGHDVALQTVAATDAERTYRFERDWSTACVCEVVEHGGNPVSSLRARDGALHVTVNAPDVDALSETITDLNAQFGGVSLQELTESDGSGGSDPVLVDRARLTDRQRQVVETAHEMGYFEYPKGANAGEVAEELLISGSTFAEHLAAAQSKLLRAILDD